MYRTFPNELLMNFNEFLMNSNELANVSHLFLMSSYELADVYDPLDPIPTYQIDEDTIVMAFMSHNGIND